MLSMICLLSCSVSPRLCPKGLWLLCLWSFLASLAPDRCRGSDSADQSFIETTKSEASQRAGAYIALFCEVERLRSQCDILQRQIGVLEAELSVSVQPTAPQLEVLAQSTFRPEMEAILSDARVVALPILTNKALATEAQVADETTALRNVWLRVRTELEQVTSRLHDPHLTDWAETNWLRTWKKSRFWYWLCILFSILAVMFCITRQSRPSISRVFRAGRTLKSLGLAVLLLSSGTALALGMWHIFRWSEGSEDADMAQRQSAGCQAPRTDSRIAALRGQADDLRSTYTSLVAEYQSLTKSWSRRVTSTVAYSNSLPPRILDLRHAVWKWQSALSLAAAIRSHLGVDQGELERVRAEVTQRTQAELRQIRAYVNRHILAGSLVLACSALAVVPAGIIAKLIERNNATTCPACGVKGKLVGEKTTRKASSPDADDISSVAMLKCVASIKGNLCEYEFAATYATLPRLTIPTCGAAQTGKTMWLAMVYQQLTQKISRTRPRFERVLTRHGDDLDSAIERIISQRQMPAATKTDRIPRPLVFKARDGRWFGNSSVLLSLLDFPGEMTNAWSVDDSRKRRALQVNGLLYFLDPTKSHARQMNELQGFIQDLRLVRKTPDGHPETIPLAACLCKIDELTRMDSSSSHRSVQKFHEHLRSTDPGNRPPNLKTVKSRSEALAQLWKEIWPGWKIAKLVEEEFRGPCQFFPLTPIGLDRGSDTDSDLGKADLSKRTLSPFGLLEPLLWLMHMNGIDAL